MTNIRHIAYLANIPLSSDEEKPFTTAFDETLQVFENLKNVDVQNVTPTYQVTGLENIWREDSVNTDKMFSQKQALANAKQTYEGYVVVSQIIDQE